MVAEQDPLREPSLGRLADPTRDIRLPPLPGRPGPELPAPWAGLHVPAGRADAGRADVGHVPAGRADVGRADAEQVPAPPRPTVAPNVPAGEHPTDRLASPNPPTSREPTLTFTGTPAQQWAAGHAAGPDPAWSSAPAGPGRVTVTARPRTRRWPWIVLTLLPVLIIVVTGLWLLLLLG